MLFYYLSLHRVCCIASLHINHYSINNLYLCYHQNHGHFESSRYDIVDRLILTMSSFFMMTNYINFYQDKT